MIEAIELTSTRRSRGPGGGPVAQVSFDVYPGQVTALLGAAGAGKSTVLRMMAELEPGAGRTLFSGRPYHALRPAVREVGLALNPDAVHPGRTVQAHLQLYSAAGGVPKARIAEVLEVAGLSTQAAVRCGRLDAGQRQRLAIAAALLGDPSALILDEPHALDSHGMSWFHALIRAYAAQGRTVLVAATDPESLAGTADHVVILRRDDEDGVSRVIASRSAAEVFDEHRALVVQVRSPQAARLAAALETEGARLSAAGPGALQVRGLDRARIGEVAHLAGICLHELSEIGHDDDVFGLRPVPRQKELLPGLTSVPAEDAGPVTPWSSGVRLISTDTPPSEIEEAEVIEPAPETADVEQSPVGEAETSYAPAEQPQVAVDSQSSAAVPNGDGQAAAEVSVDMSRWRQAAAITLKAADPSQAGEAGSGNETAGGEAPRWWQTAASPPKSAATVGGNETVGAEAGQEPPRWWQTPPSSQQAVAPAGDVQPVAGAGADESPSVGSEPGEPAQASTVAPQVADDPNGSHVSDASVPPQMAEAPAEMAAAEPPGPRRGANRAFGTFRRGRGKAAEADAAPESEPEVVVTATSAASAPSQPAVPFTVAAAPSAAAEADGMTPWRAVAARAGQQQPQGSVAEAASAEQEASA
ncbi:MAG: ATP-binding cassette domain-containing protein [Catenulispora sp.]|nr:ATP-binding cassette domain-containing protein [Catenulispora sp.]